MLVDLVLYISLNDQIHQTSMAVETSFIKLVHSSNAKTMKHVGLR